MKRGRPAGSAKVPASPHMSRQGSAKNLYLPVSRNNSKNDLSVSPPPSPPLRAASPRRADSNNKVICLYLPNKPKDHGASDEQVQWSNCDRCGKWRKLPGDDSSIQSYHHARFSLFQLSNTVHVRFTIVLMRIL